MTLLVKPADIPGMRRKHCGPVVVVVVVVVVVDDACTRTNETY
jgi:hypothetical protein